jgi:excinuclease ABC subunit A
VLIIEHHPDVIAAADWIIELGPGAGKHGGALVFSGTPRQLADHPESPTARALAGK